MIFLQGLIQRFDAWLCRQYGVFAFCQDRACVLKLQFSRAPHALQIEGVSISKGDPVLVIHLWNDHLPELSPTGDDLIWGIKMQRMFRNSLVMAAKYVLQDVRFHSVRAVMGVTTLFAPPRDPHDYHPMQRFGFTVIPYHGPLGRFGEFWENFYAWMLVWSFNPSSASRWNIFKIRRSEIWMTVETFIERYNG